MHHMLYGAWVGAEGRTKINRNSSSFINVQHYQAGSWSNVLLFKDDLATSTTSIISVSMFSTRRHNSIIYRCIKQGWIMWKQRIKEFINILTALAGRTRKHVWNEERIHTGHAILQILFSNQGMFYALFWLFFVQRVLVRQVYSLMCCESIYVLTSQIKSFKRFNPKQCLLPNYRGQSP